MTKSLVSYAFRFIPIALILWLGIALNALSRDDQTPPQNIGPQDVVTANDFKIKVGVEEVRLDAVVVDGKGRQITDLTADDFEIYQDEMKQEIIGCRYIAHDRAIPGQQAFPSPDFGKIPSIPAPPLKRDAVQRTLIFLVNDFGMGFAETYHLRMSLRKFVEEQMLPGDLVSIIKTSHGSATLQAFTSNKQELLSRIDTIQWSTFWDLPTLSLNANALDKRLEHEAQLLTLDYCIKALENMPGRKFIMLITDISAGPQKFHPRYNIMADVALRAGVVVHTMDIGGIKVFEGSSLGGPDIGYANRSPNWFSGSFEGIMGTSSIFAGVDGYDMGLRQYTYSGDNPLPISKKTGGLFLDNNFFINGIGDLEEEMKGYYLLSYIPPAYTFSKSGRTAYHNIKIKVKRKGLTVHTRDGFFGDPAILVTPDLTPPPLVEAMFSPFQYNDLNVTLASGYVDNLQKGYLLPTWMHLDGRDLDIIEEEDGSYSVSFKAAASTTDVDGIFQDYGDMEVKFRINKEDIRNLEENGINFTISIPVKKHGGYYVRAAVQDQFSEAKGSAYQFIEIPDLKKKRLALSSLYIIDREEDASWIRSMATEEPGDTPDAAQPDINRNPADKDFLPGDSFEYMTVIYNAKTKKKNPPELESQILLYRDGIGLLAGRVEAVDLSGVNDFKRIPVRKTFRIEDTMVPGDYVLQFLVKDKKAKEKQSLTAQILSFRVAEQQ